MSSMCAHFDEWSPEKLFDIFKLSQNETTILNTVQSLSVRNKNQNLYQIVVYTIYFLN